MQYAKRLATEIGKRVSTRRQRLGLTQEELAKKLKITGAQISYIERGERGPSLVTLHKLAKVLGTTVGRLVPDEI